MNFDISEKKSNSSGDSQWSLNQATPNERKKYNNIEEKYGKLKELNKWIKNNKKIAKNVEKEDKQYSINEVNQTMNALSKILQHKEVSKQEAEFIKNNEFLEKTLKNMHIQINKDEAKEGKAVDAYIHDFKNNRDIKITKESPVLHKPLDDLDKIKKIKNKINETKTDFGKILDGISNKKSINTPMNTLQINGIKLAQEDFINQNGINAEQFRENTKKIQQKRQDHNVQFLKLPQNKKYKQNEIRQSNETKKKQEVMKQSMQLLQKAGLGNNFTNHNQNTQQKKKIDVAPNILPSSNKNNDINAKEIDSRKEYNERRIKNMIMVLMINKIEAEAIARERGVTLEDVAEGRFDMMRFEQELFSEVQSNSLDKNGDGVVTKEERMQDLLEVLQQISDNYKGAEVSEDGNGFEYKNEPEIDEQNEQSDEQEELAEQGNEEETQQSLDAFMDELADLMIEEVIGDELESVQELENEQGEEKNQERQLTEERFSKDTDPELEENEAFMRRNNRLSDKIEALFADDNNQSDISQTVQQDENFDNKQDINDVAALLFDEAREKLSVCQNGTGVAPKEQQRISIFGN